MHLLSQNMDFRMIIPRTNYYGSGELESKDEDLLYPETDNCCQKHDYYPEKIARFSRKFFGKKFHFYHSVYVLCDVLIEIKRKQVVPDLSFLNC